ncbi:MAG: arginine--tRNA ligase [Candidatus Tectomicrobia bacterium]|nr:arginine--tRNA ligase [Candidatus Tectomicrobia bacterium]
MDGARPTFFPERDVKRELEKTLEEACHRAAGAGDLSDGGGGGWLANAAIERPRLEEHGDFSTNLAMVLASAERKPPRKIAEAIQRHIGKDHPMIGRAEVAGPGFLNFFIRPEFVRERLRAAAKAGEDFGRSDAGKGKKVQVEFVSANPTGPLHIGHGRGAAVGDTLSRILEFAGHRVEREYYINDAGNQIETLGRSVYLRYQEAAGKEVKFPAEYYQGRYISDLAEAIYKEAGPSFLDRDAREAVQQFGDRAARVILADIRKDLKDFNVEFDVWFSEQSLHDSGAVPRALETLKARGHVFESDGALWLRSSAYGDEKDRVVVRKDGRPTYLASDVAYHHDKFQRGFDTVIDIWGADHHGYLPRMNAVVQMLGRPAEDFRVLLVQLVSLTRGGQPVSMSTRQGQYVELAEVVREVGADATRFFLLLRSCDSQLEFDLDLAKQQSSENPVYYTQYAHARVCSVLQEAQSQGLDIPDPDSADLSPLTLPEERSFMMALLRFPEVVEGAALSLEPHRLTHFLMEVAALFHNYYRHHRFISEDARLTAARLLLVRTAGVVVKRALQLLGISAPETM